ncbi:MAG: FAD-dependent oxidoreductase [Devosiaceae bacterium]|nr:FAD-dependent oxidoreductase [Devosiaceae bacterium]
MSINSVDVLVVGAGPAGLSAAIELSKRGATTMLIDEQAQPGGQIYRGVELCGESDRKLFGYGYVRGRKIIEDFRQSPIDYKTRTVLVSIESNHVADIFENGVLKRVQAGAIIIATGAYERPVPIKGWTLPGVMTIGAAQIAAKQASVIPSGRTVIVGNGALLWLLAWQYRNFGASIDAIIDLGGRKQISKLLRDFWGFAASSYFLDGAKYYALSRVSTRVITARDQVEILGDTRVEGVVVMQKNGKYQKFAADTVLLHDGILPNTNLLGAIGCEMLWSLSQCSWRPKVNIWQETSVSGVFAAGDNAGIDGAIAAEYSGRIAALDALRQLQILTSQERDTLAQPWIRQRSRARWGRNFIDAYFSPSNTVKTASDATIVCRCEAITHESVSAHIQQEPRRLAHLKSMTRCGMGPCQGRMCSPSVAALTAQISDVHPYQVGPPSHRFPVSPLPLAALAKFDVGLSQDAGKLHE